MLEPVLAVQNLNVDFETDQGTKQILHDISLTVHPHETVCLVGESGSGKSVTSFSVMGLLPQNGHVASGSIRFEKQDLLKLGDKAMRRLRGDQMSMIFQEPMTALNPVLRIGKQLTDVIKAHQAVDRKTAFDQALALLKQVEMPEPAKKLQMYPHELSGGQRQRVMIAMAIACKPQLLIADEPTTALDVTIQAQILELINKLKDQEGMGVLFITHDMGVVAQIADYVVVMKQGRIVERGTAQTIFEHPQNAYTKKLLAAVPDVDAPHIAQHSQVTDKQPLLAVQHLTKVYQDKKQLFRKRAAGLKAVNDVSFHIYPGETLGLVGESGSGKSTLGRTILGLEQKTAGKMVYAGKELPPFNHRQAALIAKMQMIFQDPFGSLDPRQKIGDAIEEVMAIHHQMNAQARHQRMLQLLQAVDLDEASANRYPSEFSGGQRQRIGIARALALDPSLVVCDEAVSALDVSIQAQVLDLLKQLQEKLKLTYLFITHDLGVVREISDRILVMYLGTIVETGTTEQIFTNPVHPYTKRLLAAIPRPNPESAVAARQRNERILAEHIPRPTSTELHEVEPLHLVVNF
ncbi:ABC transporter ATP-binding protein [Lacticaseibacillus casei]|jgi:ABC-type glutathione transport system ATPase component|uniref:ABC transporter ATP-binding protein n=1 Tax=Lacticaseibacillus huelsenbergensis TaxID=3035291 RepID=A0ABY8DZR1_9LACO|nr:MULTISPECIES: ABC transporter ATP-binding protein [Lacticaseibacillus]MDG3062210.1 ABC transporter ATP-binding protein [Lacticaseibacillus sp. BCRC 81376]QVI36253.1 ABC transporter ATP-binding protein [Lacticaseibacillus casei]QXG58050.1 ABC transporter ATP-binding protein [Lacticaseibacillus casei]WFB40476.1 ABC transporter ATP-binding protein [Lacticaseibacillus huelsenbergensis]WFB42226.1 ABC transporter ATP-binding protein [Lacticaseibacillus huelsenbergensis]